jgi:ribulose kinase
LHADICGQPIAITAQPDATALGAAMCAAVGAGCFPDLPAAGTAMVQILGRIEPNLATRATYDELYGYYLATYDALRDLMHQMNRRLTLAP